MPEIILNADEALAAMNTLRSNIVATQNAGWSNTIYPFVAILNAAGLEQFNSSEEEIRQHMDCYGGAGGFPGNLKREPREEYVRPVSEMQHLKRQVRLFLDNPTDDRRQILERLISE